MGIGGIDSNTALMLHFNGIDAAIETYDSSFYGNVATANGNAQLDTAQSVFGGSSGLFDGTGDFFEFPDSSLWDFGLADFTFDLRVRFNSLASDGSMIDSQNGGGGGGGIAIGWKTGNSLRVYSAGNFDDFAWTPAINIWYHIAVTRAGSSLRAFVDGTQIGATVTNTDNITGIANTLRVGERVSNVDPLNGWLDEVRVSKGVARWTANFTIPTEEYSTIGHIQINKLRPRIFSPGLAR